MSTFIKNGSPSLAKRIEKEITSEAVREDKKVQHALKELHNLEKADKKVTKQTDKAGKALDKAERKEDSTHRALNKATKGHEDAVTMISRREKELQALRVKEEKTHAALRNVKDQVEESIREKDAHERERMRRLEAASITSYVEGGDSAVKKSHEIDHAVHGAQPTAGAIATAGGAAQRTGKPANEAEATHGAPVPPPRQLA